MDITQGEFKDVFNCSSTNTSKPSTRASSRGSFSCSLEILAPEQTMLEKAAIKEAISQVGSASEIKHSSDLLMQNDFRSSPSKNVEPIFSQQFSDGISKSSSSSSLSETELLDIPDHKQNDVEDNEENDLEKAIKKMKHLDNILLRKMKREKEVKKQRFMIQKKIYSEFESIDNTKECGPHSDAVNNTMKYLALLPPKQQLDVLLERRDTTEDFEPIFPTQVRSTHSQETLAETVPPRPSTSGKSDTDEKAETHGKSHHKPSSADSDKRHRYQESGKTNFIERNIQLAKDAGNVVAMTEEEKTRLGELLKDLDDDTEETADDTKTDELNLQAVIAYGEGYTPEQVDMKHLQEIDEKLQGLLTPSVYNSISSTPSRTHTYSAEMAEIGRKIAKSNVTETLNPTQRLKEIEERLSSLNDKWKERFEGGGVCLSDEQLHRLLDECSRCTSPNSITKSQLSKLDYYDNDSDVFDHAHDASETNSTTTHAEALLDSRCSFSSEFSLTPTENSAVQLKPPPLEKDVLDALLREARTSLGIPHFPPEEEDSSTEKEDSGTTTPTEEK